MISDDQTQAVAPAEALILPYAIPMIKYAIGILLLSFGFSTMAAASTAQNFRCVGSKTGFVYELSITCGGAYDNGAFGRGVLTVRSGSTLLLTTLGGWHHRSDFKSFTETVPSELSERIKSWKVLITMSQDFDSSWQSVIQTLPSRETRVPVREERLRSCRYSKPTTTIPAC